MLRRVTALIPGHKQRRMSNEPKNDPVKELLKQILDSNGGTPTIEKERAMWVVLGAIYDDMSWLKDKVLLLERESIIHWAKAHKAETAVILAVVAFAMMAWHDAYPYLIRFFESLAPLKSMLKP